MASSQNLTKKQKKAVAFRDRKHGKPKTKGQIENAGDDEDYVHDVPVQEDQDLADVQGDILGDEDESAPVEVGVFGKSKEKERPRPRSKEDPDSMVVEPKPKKRKREAVVETKVQSAKCKGSGGEENPKTKEIQGNSGHGLGVVEKSDGEEQKDAKNQGKQRFILFLGNLKYTTTMEAIQGHFAACDPPPTIRLLTPKLSYNKPFSSMISKSKGCAFLEFGHHNALQQGLKLHHSQLDGRQINVELTVGGGGRSATRLTKVKERNKELEMQRRKRLGRQIVSNDGRAAARPDGPKRYSTTSGIDQAATKKRTWTVEDSMETAQHRDGKRDTECKRPRVKDWATGVNAIPVG
ncbi:hypothetical protein SERLA73DRAFT_173960 [Serpula lacrymans var. lacrymans S7.3]|uniref:RRM domain-containing protein n=1 Tax=Serpula lacrymans var. lacrymans (strain S7.3) TaxID=936435 RepID=F8PGA3_SERL3|nr:hypothetical protein SERLA73DRAFT_173960 [Serpula lacrymans var. lacrymans S7.3]